MTANQDGPAWMDACLTRLEERQPARRKPGHCHAHAAKTQGLFSLYLCFYCLYAYSLSSPPSFPLSFSLFLPPSPSLPFPLSLFLPLSQTQPVSTDNSCLLFNTVQWVCVESQIWRVFFFSYACASSFIYFFLISASGPLVSSSSLVRCCIFKCPVALCLQ